MGELHVVFTVLKVLGKIINNSGLDLSFEEAGIYGPATLCQIKEETCDNVSDKGRETLISFFRSAFCPISHIIAEIHHEMLEKHPDIHQRLKEIIDTSTTATMNENSSLEIKESHNKIKSVLLSVNFRTLQSNFDESLKNQARFFRNYMKVFEHLLLFLHATRQQIWTLHLTSLHVLSRYFFAYDMINYARITPVYLAQMFALKEKEEEAWNILNDGNFSVNKSNIVYTALGADHALEQANKTMKIHGGVKGIANNQVSLDQYFIIAPEIFSIIEKFYTFFGITDSDDQEHH